MSESSRPEVVPLPTLDEHGYSVGSGVLALADSRIEVVPTADGFYRYAARDRASLSDIDSSKLLKYSAMSDSALSVDEIAGQLFGHVPKVAHHEVVGYYHGCYAGHVSEGDYRRAGSSGGLTTWVLVELMKNRLIDGVIHVKRNSSSGSTLFEYAISTTVDQIRDGAQSRYYAVEVSDAARQAKQNGGRYAFVGIPEVLREFRLLSVDQKEFANTFPYLIGLVCGHQKSTHYADAMAWQFGVAPGQLAGIEFRVPRPGATADRYSTQLRWQSGGDSVERTVRQEEFLISNWALGAFKARFSDFTDDAFNETADLTVGDAWLSEYVADGLGNNIAIARHPVLHEIIERGVRDGQLTLDRVPVDVVIKSQGGLVRHVRDELPYRLWKAESLDLWHPRTRTVPERRLPAMRRRIQDERWKIRERSFTAYRDAVEANDWKVFADEMQRAARRYRTIDRIAHARALGFAGTVRAVAAKATAAARAID